MKKLSRKLFYVTISAYLLCSSMSSLAQSPDYTIESFQGVYTELTSYQSILLLTQGDPLWEYEFQLEFPFPFYDSVYTRIWYNQDAWGSFTDDQDVALYLFHANWTYENVADTNNITSDVRFNHVEVDGMQAFVIQFTKARFFADPFADSLDTYLNFQIWFYENGVMEVQFGEIHMDNSPIYVPGVGFYEYTTSGGVDTTYVDGPLMGISHPLNENNAIALEGAYNDYEIVGDLYANMTLLPPHGWVIRFKPVTVSTKATSPAYEHVQIIPNPATTYIQLPKSYDSIIVYDGTGSMVAAGCPKDDTVDVSALPPGLYYLRAVLPETISTGIFLKQ